MITTASSHFTLHSSASRAFTLLEVLVTLAIAGIVLAGTSISLAIYRRDSSLSRAALSLRLLAERAYSQTLATHQEHVLIVAQAAAAIKDTAGVEQERLRFPAPVVPLLKENTPQEIRFFPSMSSSPATVTLRSGAHGCRVIISLRGRVRTECD